MLIDTAAIIGMCHAGVGAMLTPPAPPPTPATPAALPRLRWLVAWLAVASIPYLVMIHISKFAPSPALPSATAVEGVSVFGGRPSLFSFTLAGLVDESKDNNTLPWMQYMVAGSAVVHSVKKEHFLLCACLACGSGGGTMRGSGGGGQAWCSAGACW